MKLISWHPSMSVNNKKIDEQHQGLLELTNNIAKQLDENVKAETVHLAVEEMFRYLDEHFKDEEEYLRSFQYPQFNDHRKKHLSFIKNAWQFFKKSRSASEPRLVLLEVHQYLANWLFAHIVVEDAKFCAHKLMVDYQIE